MLKKIIASIDWTFFIRLVIGLFLIGVGIQHQDWIPGIFGAFWIAVGSYAAYTKTGCGYNGYCGTNKTTTLPDNDEIEFTEVK
jgi:hypothetical protein